MLEPECQYRFADLPTPAARPSRRSAIHQELGDLLRDRRATLDDPALHHVLPEGTYHRDRIEADMRPEPPILRGNGCIDERKGQIVGAKPDVAGSVTR